MTINFLLIFNIKRFGGSKVTLKFIGDGKRNDGGIIQTNVFTGYRTFGNQVHGIYAVVPVHRTSYARQCGKKRLPLPEHGCFLALTDSISCEVHNNSVGGQMLAHRQTRYINITKQPVNRFAIKFGFCETGGDPVRSPSRSTISAPEAPVLQR